MNKDNIPKGEYRVEDSMHKYEYSIEVTNKKGSIIICDSVDGEDVAKLITEAFNVFSKTGMTPKELSEKHYEYLQLLTIANNDNKHIQQQRDRDIIKAYNEGHGDGSALFGVDNLNRTGKEYLESLNTPQEQNNN